MKKTFIDIGIDKINRIYHISDIHIRNLKRHKEYKECFNRLYSYIKKDKKEGDIVFLGGDIVHAKTDMTPEVVKLTAEFLYTLSELLPTVMIPGNHDANLNNLSRMDALTPIVDALKSKNLYYLKDTGIYEIGGCTFVHQSVFDNVPGFIPSKLANGDNKIAVFHGPVDRVVTEHGFSIDSTKITVNSFDGYDMVLLGDIHKPNNAVMGMEHIKYPGSLIMQNHSESIFPDHGFLVWDVKSRKNEFVVLHNDYGYVTIDVEDGKIVSNTYIPEKPRIRVRVKNTKQSDLNKILSGIKRGKKVQELTIQKVIDKKYDENGSDKIFIHNIRDVAYQNKLIEDYLSLTEQITDTQIGIVKSINTDINTKMGTHTMVGNSVWIPTRFEFSNMFSYGEGNVIDFTNMKGSYGMFAPNAGGKSSIFDSLSFCIFDKCARTSKAEDIMNHSKNTFKCKFVFELDGIEYFIEREASRSDKGKAVKVITNFYRVVNGVKESLNGEQRRDTNQIIRTYVGSYDDFILTAMSTQFNNTGFIDKGQKEKKELLAQFLDINVFESLYQIANEEIKELSILLKEYKSKDFTTLLATSIDKLESINKSISELNDKKVELQNRSKILVEKIEFNLSNLKQVDSSIGDIPTIENELKVLENQSESVQSRINQLINSVKPIKTELETLRDKFDTLDVDLLKEKNKLYESFDNKVKDVEIKLTHVKSLIEHKTEHLKGIGSLSFDDDCEHCIKNKNTPFAKEALTLEDEIQNLSNKYSELVTQKVAYLDSRNENDVKSKLQSVSIITDRMHELERESSNIEKKIGDLKFQKTTIISSIEATKNKLQKSVEQKESVKHNKELQSIISELKSNRSSIDDSLNIVNDDILLKNGEKTVEEVTIQNINDSIEKLADLEKKYDGYEFYLKCVKRNGIPYHLISEVLPKLESEINNILTSIVDFQLVFNTDGKNINSYIAYSDDDYWPLELTSGMEKFISSIAIRSALINVSNLPRPNFIAIDEGMGSLDTDNFNSLYLLFDYLKTQFDFIIIISHIDKTRDMVDGIIDINKSDGFSKIYYL